MNIKKNRQQIYKEIWWRYYHELVAIERLPEDYASRRANIYAVKNTNRVYNSQ